MTQEKSGRLIDPLSEDVIDECTTEIKFDTQVIPYKKYTCASIDLFLGIESLLQSIETTEAIMKDNTCVISIGDKCFLQ